MTTCPPTAVQTCPGTQEIASSPGTGTVSAVQLTPSHVSAREAASELLPIAMQEDADGHETSYNQPPIVLSLGSSVH